MNSKVVLNTVLLVALFCSATALDLSALQDLAKDIQIECNGEPVPLEKSEIGIGMQCGTAALFRNIGNLKGMLTDFCIADCVATKKGVVVEGNFNMDMATELINTKLSKKNAAAAHEELARCKAENPGTLTGDSKCASYGGLSKCGLAAVLKVCFPNGIVLPKGITLPFGLNLQTIVEGLGLPMAPTGRSIDGVPGTLYLTH